MNRNILTHALYSAIIAVTFCARVVSANNFVNPLSTGSDLGALLTKIVEVVIFMLIPVIVLMLVYTGFLFVQAQGNPAKISEAKKVFVWTLVGAFVILAAETLQRVIKDTVESL